MHRRWSKKTKKGAFTERWYEVSGLKSASSRAITMQKHTMTFWVFLYDNESCSSEPLFLETSLCRLRLWISWVQWKGVVHLPGWSLQVGQPVESGGFMKIVDQKDYNFRPCTLENHAFFFQIWLACENSFDWMSQVSSVPDEQVRCENEMKIKMQKQHTKKFIPLHVPDELWHSISGQKWTVRKTNIYKESPFCFSFRKNGGVVINKRIQNLEDVRISYKKYSGVPQLWCTQRKRENTSSFIYGSACWPHSVSSCRSPCSTTFWSTAAV